jgi:N-acetyl-gamma-glutamyl-phosphate reductase
MSYRATVLGASGYAGGEVVRLLAAHPLIDVGALGADSRAGSAVAEALPNLGWSDDRSFATLGDAARDAADVCFSCLPSGALTSVVEQIAAPSIVDLSGDHRSDPHWVYGLPEYARDKIAGSRRIANPGCYPTAVLLALVPLASAGLIKGPLIVDGLSGTSGAGRTGQDDLSFSGLHGSTHAYGDIPHRHVAEMQRGIEAFGGVTAAVSFTPHLVPMSRGVLVTARAVLGSQVNDGDLLEVLGAEYAHESFVTVTDRWPDTKSVAGSNRAHAPPRVDREAGVVVASCAIDNLGKGAAGQAIQNANLALGIDETCGLSIAGVWP